MKKWFAGVVRFGAAILVVGQIAAQSTANAQCTNCVGDGNADGEVTIDEILTAVNNALDGCNRAPTPTPTVPPTTAPTATATPTSGVACAVTPGAWSAPQWATNAATALALRVQLANLTGNNLMRGAETGTVVLGGVAQLFDAYHAGSPSLADVTTRGYDAVVDQSFEEFVALVAAGASDPINDQGLWTPAANGGLFGTSPRGLNAGGLEIRQIVDKGLFAGAALYNYALGLTEGPITPATIEAMAAAWGTNDTLSASGAQTQSANYSRGMGFYARMATALTNAHAFAESAACNVQRDEAIRTFFRLWEQSMLARTLYYLNLSVGISGSATNDSEKINAMHETSEGAGLAWGFRGVPHPQSGPLAGAGRVITDAQVDQILTALRINASDLNSSTTGTFLEGGSAFAAATLAVEQIVAEAYGLDAAEIASYRTPVAG